jgi:hypothetical protein
MEFVESRPLNPSPPAPYSARQGKPSLQTDESLAQEKPRGRRTAPSTLAQVKRARSRPTRDQLPGAR